MKQFFYRILTIAALSSLAVACSDEADTPTPPKQDTPPTRDDNLALGNPSGATTNTANASNYLLTKTQYALSYNPDQRKHHWVSCHLSSA